MGSETPGMHAHNRVVGDRFVERGNQARRSGRFGFFHRRVSTNGILLSLYRFYNDVRFENFFFSVPKVESTPCSTRMTELYTYPLSLVFVRSPGRSSSKRLKVLASKCIRPVRLWSSRDPGSRRKPRATCSVHGTPIWSIWLSLLRYVDRMIYLFKSHRV